MKRMRRLEAFGPDGYPAGAGRHLIDGDLAAHSHDYLEIAVIVAGSGTHQRADGHTELQPGMVVAMRPGQWHGYLACVDADIFNLYVGPELLRRELLWTLDYPDLARFLLRGGTSTRPLSRSAAEALVGWMTDLADRSSVPNTPSAAVSLGLLCCALGEMATGSFDTAAGRRSISPTVRQALLVMSDEPAAAWTMSALARCVDVSVPHLHRRFTAEMGTSPMAWLARTRVELAASMLIQDGRSVSEIGQRVGWPDPNYFSRRFRELSGDSPSEYRRRFQV